MADFMQIIAGGQLKKTTEFIDELFSSFTRLTIVLLIKNIIKYIEKLGKKRILVEDIQDIIEMKLMSIGKYNLAKKYIIYRYNRALIRKANTTDLAIKELIDEFGLRENTISSTCVGCSVSVMLVPSSW